MAAAFAVVAAAPARPAAPEPLHHYGVALIGDGKAESDFAARFNAQGRPLFLISDLARGVALGDIIRFKDKVVLIDEEVWQTMKATGVLADIRNVPVVALSAQSKSAIWKSRADLAEGREKIAYTLGAEFITVLEQYFGSIPERMEIAFRFDGNKMTILAPNEMLGVLRFVARNDKSKQDKTPARSQPAIVSEPPRRAFTGQPFAWTLWAVDPGYPSQDLRYSLESRPPPGMEWDEGRHALVGKPSKAGAYVVKVRASNAASRSDALEFTLEARPNRAPRIGGHPEREQGPDGRWTFQPQISDPDHLFSELKVEAQALPPGMAFDAATSIFSFRPGEVPADGTAFGLKVTDPLGAKEEKTFDLAKTEGDLRFRSALSAASLVQGQASHYSPVAVGPGRDIRYAARSGEEAALSAVEGRIPLSTGSPGRYLLEVSAEDELGNRASQILAYQVLPRESMLHNFSARARHLGGASLAESWYRLGRARFGVLQPGLRSDALPFIYAGFEPIPASLAGRRHLLFLDLGFNAQGTSGVTYGGIMARLDGQYNRFREDPWVFRYSAHYHARQGLILFNPADFKENDLGDGKLEACLQDLRSRTDRADSLVADFLACHDGVDRLMEAYGSGDNEVFMVDLALWLNLGYSFSAGPAYWLEDHFHARRNFEQRLGLGLAHQAAFKWIGFEAAARLGFANAPSDLVKIHFDLSLRFGRAD